MESNQLALPTDWNSLKEQATMLVKSGFLPTSVNSPEKAIAIAITSKELGIGMMEGFRSINVIQGKPTVSPQLMLALANRTGSLENIKIDATDERCTVTVQRKGREPHTETFGVKEATALGLIDRDNYRKQRATMFKWRALAANLRVTFPDVMLGLYTPEEMGADVKVGVSDEMEIVDTGEGYPTGVRVPKKYWDLKDTDPAAAQALIGEGFFPKKVVDADPKKTGWFLFSKEKVSEDWMEKEKQNEVRPIEQRSPTEKRELAEGLEKIFTEPTEEKKTVTDEPTISMEQQLEIIKIAKERGMTQQSLKKYLKDTYGVSGWSKIPAKFYLEVYNYISSLDVIGIGK